MNSAKWTILGIGPLMLCAACAHRTPIASQANLRVPVAVASVPASTPTRTPAATAGAQQTKASQAVPAQRSATLSSAERETLNQRLAHLDDALFDYNKTSIRSDAQVVLRDDVTVIRGILSNYPAQKLLIEGHADQRGSSEYNLALGDRRARAAEEFLSGMGIAKGQLRVISYGEEKPACTDSTEGCWQRNRRAHITAAP